MCFPPNILESSDFGGETKIRSKCFPPPLWGGNVRPPKILGGKQLGFRQILGGKQKILGLPPKNFRFPPKIVSPPLWGGNTSPISPPKRGGNGNIYPPNDQNLPPKVPPQNFKNLPIWGGTDFHFPESTPEVESPNFPESPDRGSQLSPSIACVLVVILSPKTNSYCKYQRLGVPTKKVALFGTKRGTFGDKKWTLFESTFCT